MKLEIELDEAKMRQAIKEYRQKSGLQPNYLMLTLKTGSFMGCMISIGPPLRPENDGIYSCLQVGTVYPDGRFEAPLAKED